MMLLTIMGISRMHMIMMTINNDNREGRLADIKDDHNNDI